MIFQSNHRLTHPPCILEGNHVLIGEARRKTATAPPGPRSMGSGPLTAEGTRLLYTISAGVEGNPHYSQLSPVPKVQSSSSLEILFFVHQMPMTRTIASPIVMAIFFHSGSFTASMRRSANMEMASTPGTSPSAVPIR